MNGRPWSVSAGCWQVSISPIPAADGQPQSTRSGQSIFSIAVIRADYSIIRLQTSPDLPHEKERLVAAWAR
ncbi:MAG: hypothetical protein OEM98_14115, partial [Gammaproteobacteria bacterium]|nr:hypothetical protein [Gammaproteobacteria bacterium]